MKLKDYLIDNLIIMLMYVLFTTLILYFLFLFKVPYPLIFTVFNIFIIFFTMCIFYGYNREKYFFDELVGNLDKLDKKYLITEIIKRPNFVEGKIMYDCLYEITKSMNEEIEKSNSSVNDFKEYIEMWIHEVKLPIASITLILHNNRKDLKPKLKEQIKYIENYVEQVLYYARSENSEKDYLIKKCSLLNIVNSVVMKNKDNLILKNISIEINDINNSVLSDSKWLEFIINQVISNSIKYSKYQGAKIKFNSRITDNLTILDIEDNGIGIEEKDIYNVFDKSFTGENGRLVSSSTGMGLYISKKLCNKLGHNITINSKHNVHTKVSIYFKKDEFYSDIR